MPCSFPSLLLVLLIGACALSSSSSAQSQSGLEPVTNTLYLQVCNESVIRVLALPPTGEFPTSEKFVLRKDWPDTDYEVLHSHDSVTVTTTKLTVTANKTTGQVTFYDSAGVVLLREKAGRSFNATTDLGKPSYETAQSWETVEDEAQYGLGQFQNGFVNYKHAPIQLVQFNTEAIVPFLVSTRGYGLLWDTYSWTHFNPTSNEIPLEPVAENEMDPIDDGMGLILTECNNESKWQVWKYENQDVVLAVSNPPSCVDCNGCSNGVQAHMWTCSDKFASNQQWVYDSTTKLLSSKASPASCLSSVGVKMAACSPIDTRQQWDFEPSGLLRSRNSPQKCLTVASNIMQANFSATQTGTFFFYMDTGRSFGGGFNGALNLTVNGVVAQAWVGLNNMPAGLTARVELNASTTYLLNLFSAGLDNPPVRLFVQYPDYKLTTFASEVADSIDYYFMYGGSIDATIALYRFSSGSAPLFGIWAYGFWQCKERYHNQTELLSAATEFRQRKLPVDNIVQDWHYWGDLGWGPQWDPSIYPDPRGLVQALKKMDYHFMVSVWSKFDQQTTFFQMFQQAGQLIPNSNWFDPYNPAARTLFYNFSNVSMFSIGVDALWLDATEPEFYPNINQPMYPGTGNAYMNPYSLLVTEAITQGQNIDRPDMRVFSLTRSSYAGQQRTGGVVWSGDIAGTWDSLRRQVAASINYQASGIPHWSEDIGGFFRPGDQYTSDNYHELLIRWFQFGAFTPIFRVHGGGTNTEYWNFGPDVVQNVLIACQLRYRLLPYTYTLGWKAHAQHATMQRLLAFDFPTDQLSLNVADQFLWGDSILVAPVYEYGSRSRSVYLPPINWVDFYSGQNLTGGAVVQIDAPIDHIPLLVKAGSILFLGPYLQHSQELPLDPLEVRVYAGTDGQAQLYEDDGLTQAFATRGEYTVIEFSWDDRARQLTVGAREGSFPAMLSTRTMHVVLVKPGHGTDITPCPSPDATVTYTGAQLVVQL